ncbi:MAG TPA: KTSC domain-containing protein [Allosphingosinicella sp.]|nr:KTSC domain-containing protein [Allosphingosinicella sp.]
MNKGGDRCRYFDVPIRMYQGLVSSASAGEYVDREIRPRYRYEIEQRRRGFRPIEAGGRRIKSGVT